MTDRLAEVVRGVLERWRAGGRLPASADADDVDDPAFWREVACRWDLAEAEALIEELGYCLSDCPRDQRQPPGPVLFSLAD